MLMGNVSAYERMIESSPALALVWFLVFVISVHMVLLNFLSAILVDAYAVVKERSGGNAKSIWAQGHEAVKEIGRTACRTGKASKPAPIEDMLRALDYQDEDGLVGRDASENIRELLQDAQQQEFSISDIRALGCDKANAEYLFTKCKEEISRDPMYSVIEHMALGVEMDMTEIKQRIEMAVTKMAKSCNAMHEVLDELEVNQQQLDSALEAMPAIGGRESQTLQLGYEGD